MRYVLALLAVVPISALAQSRLMPDPYVPVRLERYSAFCALWRTDVTFRSTIRISNQLAASPIDVTPTLYMADGTAIDLPTVHVPQSGVATVDVNAALAQSPAGLLGHVSTFGSAAIRYQYDWQGAAYATMSILDLTRSLEYSYPFVSPPGQGAGEQGFPASVRAARDAANAQTYEGLWFRNTATSGGFLALANASESALGVGVAVSGLGQPAGRSLSLSKHSTALIDLKDFFAGQGSMVGGITVTQTGPPGALQLAGGLQDLTTGYSTDLPFTVAKTSPGEMGFRQYSSVGLMVNQQDPLLNFPTGLTFYPYAFFRNVSAADRILHMNIYVMDSGHAKSLPLPDLTLGPGQVAGLPIHDVLVNQKQVESMSLALSYTGDYGDIIAATGSTDATGNYVFPVVPQVIAPSGSKTSVYWLTSGGFDTMYTVWNPGSDAEDLLATLHYGSAGETYRLPLHLEAYASEMIDIGELIRTRQLDQNGATLPLDVSQGSVVLSSAAGAPEDLINAVFTGGIYNPQKATCGTTCETCSGMTVSQVNPSSATTTVGGNLQYHFSYTWSDGTVYDVTSFSGWSSDQPPVLPVQTYGQTAPGNAQGASLGQAHIMPVYPLAGILPVNAGQICAPVGSLPPCPTTPQISGNGSGSVAAPSSVKATQVADPSCPPSSNYGVEVDITYQLYDKNGNKLAVAGLVPCETDTIDGVAFPTCPLAGGAATDANGTFVDTPVGKCSKYPFSKNVIAEQKIQMQAAGANPPNGPCTDPSLLGPVIRDNTFTISDPGGTNGFGHGTITNGSDVSASR